MEAKPQVIPVFIAGLCNSLPKQVARNWNREDVIRIHFGPLLDLSEHLAKPDRLRHTKKSLMRNGKDCGARRAGRKLIADFQLPIANQNSTKIGNRQLKSAIAQYVSSDS
jgi:hypothetical protein